jgi:N-acyl-D-amino-acid deacylase
MLDLVIKNALVVDGTGERKPFPADVGVQGGKIALVGTIDQEAAKVTDAAGLALAPGFIDMHSHTDLEYFREKPSDAKIRQGITTEVLGQDGLGAAPVGGENLQIVKDLLAGLDGIIPDEKWTWKTFPEYLGALERRGLNNNAAVLLCHGPVRIAALGMEERAATPAELRNMKALVRESMEEGAFGLSTGLIYPPCPYGDTEELIELNREVGAKGGIFVVHQRDEGYYLSRSFDEVSRISLESGAHLEVSHLQAYGRVNWPIMDEVMEKAERMVEKGGSISWDRYPYLAGCTVLTAVLPNWTFNEGTAALVRNLRKPEFRARVHADFTKGLDVWHNRQISVGWENIVVTAVQLEENKWMEGLSCRAIADRLGKDPIDMVMDLLAAEKLAVTMISFYGSDTVLEKVLGHPRGTVGSDGIFGGKPHPRLYGAYPCFFRRFVREKPFFTLEEAVRKVTSFPASILGIPDRGRIEEGCWADMVIFDPEKIADRSTYDIPEAYPEGIPYVFVNGTAVVEEGETVTCTPGKVLRHGK